MSVSEHLKFMNNKRFFIASLLSLALLLTSFIRNDTQEDNDGKFVVVLDAGHGGHDPGNLGNGYLEKNIALKIVLKVGELLESNPNIKVIYTRDDDTFVDLYVRGEIANKANADLFVSVHCDSHSSDAHGAGTFVLGLHANKQNFEIAKKENQVIYLEDNYETRYADYDINSPESVIGLTIMQEEFLDQSISLAKTIQDNFSNKLKRKDRQVKQAGFIVLHQTFMPSVLVETGFLTNDSEGAYLNSTKGQSEMGTAIAESIVAYRAGIEFNTTAISEEEVAVSSEPEIAEEVVEKIEEAAKEPEEMVVAKVDEVVENTKSTAEEFAKNPGENPMAVKKVAEDPVTESIDEKQIVETDKMTKVPPVVVEAPTEEIIKAVNIEPKPSIEEPSIAIEEVAAKEEPVVQVIEEVKKEAEIVVVEEKKEVVAPKEEVKSVEKTSDVIFKVQLLASSKNLPLEAEGFGGLNKLSKEPYKNLYRYMYGSTPSYKDAKLLKSNADIKGYPTSYIVAYKDGVRISVSDAIKLISE